MKQGTRRKLLLGVVFVLEIFVLFLIGDTVAVLPIIGGAKPALMVCVAVSIALTGVKELTAMTYGIYLLRIADGFQPRRALRISCYDFGCILLYDCCTGTKIISKKFVIGTDDDGADDSSGIFPALAVFLCGVGVRNHWLCAAAPLCSNGDLYVCVCYSNLLSHQRVECGRKNRLSF